MPGGEQRGETVVDMGPEAGAEIVSGSSLKAARDRDWDQMTQREEALGLVVQVLQAVESWVQTLEAEEREMAEPALEMATVVKEQNGEPDENGKAHLIKGVAKDRRISIEDTEMRHGRKSRSVRVDGYKCHVLYAGETVQVEIFQDVLPPGTALAVLCGMAAR